MPLASGDQAVRPRFRALAIGTNSRSTVRSIRLYSICKPTKGDHPRSWASVFAWATHHAGGIRNSDVEHLALANQIIQPSHDFFNWRNLVPHVDPVKVETVLAIGRSPTGQEHEKLHEIVFDNLSDLSPVESRLSGYDACFFCLGVSAVGMKEEAYQRVTYDLTVSVAKTLAKLNPTMT